jgi:hypothetical protein
MHVRTDMNSRKFFRGLSPVMCQISGGDPDECRSVVTCWQGGSVALLSMRICDYWGGG